MISTAISVDEYIASMPKERQQALQDLRRHIVQNLPAGFQETMAYGMPAYVVPLSIYPAGYHCKKNQPLPYMSFASQKNFIAVYHMGIYADEKVHAWFVDQWKNEGAKKLDMGKSCIRLKDIDRIPYDLFGKLAKTFSVESWIALYEARYVK